MITESFPSLPCARGVRDALIKLLEAQSSRPYYCAVHLTDLGYVVHIKAPQSLLDRVPSYTNGITIVKESAL